MIWAVLVLAQWPLPEVDRPLVMQPGMAEIEVEVAASGASRWYDADSRTGSLPAGSASSAATAMVSGRYGLFQGVEVTAAVPWVARLDPAGGDPVSGSGRGELGGRYELPWPGVAWTETGEQIPPPFRIAAEIGAVLPSTARRLRTDEAGVVHKDHLAISGALRAKHHVAESTAAHVSASFVAPFANAEDRDADRDPPSTVGLTAGSTFQASDRIWADLTAAFTRTNRDRIDGGVVPRTDQFRAEIRPSAGMNFQIFDVSVRASIPVAGKNTPQTFSIASEARVRF